MNGGREREVWDLGEGECGMGGGLWWVRGWRALIEDVIDVQRG